MRKIFSIWMQPVYARLNMGDHKVWLMVLATFPFLTMGIALMGAAPVSWQVLLVAALIGIGFVLLLLLLTWFFLLVHSVAMQYSPVNARLVPHLKREMQWALAIPVLLLPVFIAAGLAFRSMEYSWSLNWLLGVFFLLMLVAMIRTNWTVLTLVVLTQIPMFLSVQLFSHEQLMRFAHPILFLAFGLIMSAGVLHWIFAMSADRHLQRRRKFAEFQVATQGNPQFARRSMPSFASAYSYLLQRQLAGKKNTLALLPFALGPQAHASSTFLQMAVTSVAISTYLFFMIARDPAATTADESFHLFLFFPMFAVMLFVHSFAMLNAIYQTRGEQGLVSLAPRSPSNALLSRSLLAYLLRQYFVLWTCTVAVALMTCVWLEPKAALRDAIYLVCFSLLPMSVCLLKNHALTKASQDSLVLHTLLLCVAIFGVALTLLMKVPGISAWVLCALIAALTTCTLIWRWQKLLAMPAVFPAGRGA